MNADKEDRLNFQGDRSIDPETELPFVDDLWDVARQLAHVPVESVAVPFASKCLWTQNAFLL